MAFWKKSSSEEKEKPGFLDRLRQGLSKTRSGLTGRLDKLLLAGKTIDEDLLDELEEILYTSDLGVVAVQELIDLVRAGVARKELKDPEKVKEALKESIIKFLDIPEIDLASTPGQPTVIMIIGVNGVGKTTTIGKLARLYAGAGHKVWLAAADTFRAAAVEQLKIWGERAGVTVVAKETGADSAGLAYEALERARAADADILLIDTAGRLHNKADLMAELQKLIRVVKKLVPEAPHDTILVLDATTGQNAHAQVETFRSMVDVTGLIVTKLDGSARGGVLVALTERFKLPVHAIGVGEGVDDLRPFEAAAFARSLFGLPEPEK